MSEFIHKYEYLDDAEDLEPGGQIHIDHEHCPAGVDTKQRLYIKRTDDGARILAHCFNCGLSGSSPASNIHKKIPDKSTTCVRSQLQGNSGVATIPADSDADISGWRPDARTWITRYGITEQELRECRILYSDSRRSVILPVYRKGKLMGYQERSLNPNKPKYLTRANEKPLYWYSRDYPLLSSSGPVDRVIIVEDILSGIKCARHFPTVSLLGATLHDATLSRITTDSNKFVVFLDDDNRQIKTQQLKIKAQLEQFGADVRIITGVGKDPKACSDGYLRKLLTKA